MPKSNILSLVSVVVSAQRASCNKLLQLRAVATGGDPGELMASNGKGGEGKSSARTRQVRPATSGGAEIEPPWFELDLRSNHHGSMSYRARTTMARAQIELEPPWFELKSSSNHGGLDACEAIKNIFKHARHPGPAECAKRLNKFN